MSYLNGLYWQGRSDNMYYKYIDYLVRVIGVNSKSIIDVGSGNSPYLEWFSWIEKKVSIDIQAPYGSSTVEAITANILDYNFQEKFDICLCLQVLEHVHDPKPFATRLFDLSDLVIISVPYKWPEGKTKGHINDPVDRAMLEEWTGRKPNYSHIVQEPLQKSSKSSRLIAIYDINPARVWVSDDISRRKMRSIGALESL
jgi:hypothetical protein